MAEEWRMKFSCEIDELSWDIKAPNREDLLEMAKRMQEITFGVVERHMNAGIEARKNIYQQTKERLKAESEGEDTNGKEKKE